MPFVASCEVADGLFHVRMAESSAATELPAECVVDRTGMGEIVGIEILDFRRQLGGATVSPGSDSGALHWSYDPEMDAFYVRCAREHAPVQIKTTCVALLDPERRVVELIVDQGQAAGTSYASRRAPDG